MKRNLVVFALAVTLMLFGGCAQKRQQMEYIGVNAAKQYALEAAGLDAAQVKFSGTDMDTRNGIDYYKVAFTADDGTYQYDIDALTGVVIDSTVPGSAPTQQQTDDSDDNSLTDYPQQPVDSTAQPSGMLTEGEAKAVALAHAGLTADQVTFVKSGLDWDDGRETYDLEFYTQDHREYDYDIDPYTGEVLSYDRDAEYYTPPAGTGNDGELTADEAKALVLAKVPGATVDNIREFEVDYDDGRLEYEGAIYYEHMEYEFEIDGYSGAIRSWEVESIYD